jgi:hypothetical protein
MRAKARQAVAHQSALQATGSEKVVIAHRGDVVEV